MNTSKLLAGALIVLGIVFIGISFRTINLNLNTSPSITAGNTPGNEYYDTQFFYGGVSGIQRQFVSTTSDVCMIQNPTNATSTFTSRIRALVSTTTVTVLSLATSSPSANRYATTSLSTALFSKKIPANTTGVGSFVGQNDQNIIGPNEWVVWFYDAGTTLGNVAQLQSGQCNVDFKAI